MKVIILVAILTLILSLTLTACGNDVEIEPVHTPIEEPAQNQAQDNEQEPQPEQDPTQESEVTNAENTEITTEAEVVVEIEEDKEQTEEDQEQALRDYLDERGQGIVGGFEARSMNASATIEVAGSDSILISLTLEDEFVRTMGVSLDFLLAVLEEEIDSVMPIFSAEAGNIEDELNIDGFHFTIKYLISTGDPLLWRSIYSGEIMGPVMTDLSFLATDGSAEGSAEATQATVGNVTSVEFDDITIRLSQPFVMTNDEFRSEFPDWALNIGTHYRWLLVYAEIINNSSHILAFGNRPFLITDEFEDLGWQSTSIERLNGTGFDSNATIASGETLSGYVPFVVTRLSSTFEIDVRPIIEGQLGSPFAGRFIFDFYVDME